jgi:eukaryotic-like serine/threonine-protein kinase
MKIGLIINSKYEITEKIASGGMSDIYLARDLKTGKKYAIKVLNQSYSINRSFVARFKKEAQILSRLSSPNIISVYEFGEYEGFYYIVMEYVKGRTLKEVIEKRGNLYPEIAVGYAIQVCQALKIAHSSGLIHRDIKSQNIMITDDGSIKVADFGIAKFTAEDITKTINVFGTAHYISPEHLEGKVLDPRSDIYSFGIVIFEMLTADLPFRGSSSMDISLKHLSEIPQPPSSIIPDIPKKLDRIVLKCLEKNPDKRYRNVETLENDLINYQTGKSLSIDENMPLHEEQNNRSGKSRKDLFSADSIFIGNLPSKLRSKLKKLTISLGVISFVLIAALITVLALFFNLNSEFKSYKNSSMFVVVPDILNTDINSASKILSVCDLKMEVKETTFKDNVSENVITWQSPESGKSVGKETVIYVIVNKVDPATSITVPNFIGMDAGKSESLLKFLNLETGKKTQEFSDYFETNLIIGQVPAAGEKVGPGTEINLIISKGRELVTVPNVIGYDYIYAKTNIESLGLFTAVKKITDLSKQPGMVLMLEPVEGSAVYRNSIVKIFISTTMQLLKVPDLKNMEYDKATQTVSSLGIDYELSMINVDYSIQKNTVIYQIPDPGEQISPNEKITIFIGQ